MYEAKQKELDSVILLLDIFFTILVFLLSFVFRNNFFPQEQIDIYSHIFLIPLLLTLVIGFLTYFGAYVSPHQASLLDYSWAIFRSIIVAIGIILSLLFVLEIQYISRFVVLLFASIDFLVLLIFRVVIIQYFYYSIEKGKNSLKILIVGTGERAKELAHELKNQVVWGLEIVGYLDPAGNHELVDDEVPVVGTVENISSCLKKYDVDEVIVAIPRSLLEDAEPIAYACEEEGIM